MKEQTKDDGAGHLCFTVTGGTAVQNAKTTKALKGADPYNIHLLQWDDATFSATAPANNDAVATGPAKATFNDQTKVLVSGLAAWKKKTAMDIKCNGVAIDANNAADSFKDSTKYCDYTWYQPT